MKKNYNFCKEPKFYQASQWLMLESDSGEVQWFGLKIDEETGIILDAKWHTDILNTNEQQALDHDCDLLIGQLI
jgi:hypothetical protein